MNPNNKEESKGEAKPESEVIIETNWH